MSQDLQNEESATTSDVKSVLPKFSQINLLHNDLVCATPLDIPYFYMHILLLKIHSWLMHDTSWSWATFPDRLIYRRACLMMISQRGLLLQIDLSYQGAPFDLS